MARIQPPLDKRDFASHEELKSGIHEVKTEPRFVINFNPQHSQIKRFLDRLNRSKTNIESASIGKERSN